MFHQRKVKHGSWRVWIARGAAAVLAAASALSLASLTSPAAAHHLDSAVRGAGYVWASNPTASHTPSSRYSENTVDDGWGAGHHGYNTVNRMGIGHYVVWYPNLAAAEGVPHVTA